LDRLILDTSILIAAERVPASFAALLADEDDVVIAAITAAELLVGIELADGQRKQRRQAFVDQLLALIPVVPYDLEIARTHAALLAYTRRSGRPRGAHDLVIAATAISHSREVVSADPLGFEGLPGLVLRAR
jgi:tRNA(fMet)-specific endonuclease VapC